MIHQASPVSTVHSSLQAQQTPTITFPQSAIGALFLGTKEVCAIFRMSRSTLYRLIAAGEFPAPIKFGIGRNGWLRIDVETHLAKRVAARGVAQ